MPNIDILNSLKKKNELLYAIWNLDDQISVEYEEVFHYTSPRGLMEIIQTSKFFFTRYDFLNDTTERMDFYRIYEDLVKETVEKEEFCKEFIGVLSEASPNFDRAIVYNMPPSFDETTGKYVRTMGGSIVECTPYLCCFSLNPDSIPMWSYYVKGDQYEGYNIGACLENIFPGKKGGYDMNFRKVIYKEGEKRKLLLEKIKEIYKIYQKGDENGASIKYTITQILNSLQLVFKNEMFSHEEEVRAILWVPTTKKKGLKEFEVKFRPKGPLMIPYVEHDYKRSGIDSVRIGPTLNEKNAYDGVKALLDSQRLSNVVIEHSQAPLRY